MVDGGGDVGKTPKEVHVRRASVLLETRRTRIVEQRSDHHGVPVHRDGISELVACRAVAGGQFGLLNPIGSTSLRTNTYAAPARFPTVSF